MKENDLRDSYLAAVRDASAVPFADPVTIRETVVSRADARAIERAMTCSRLRHQSAGLSNGHNPRPAPLRDTGREPGPPPPQRGA